MAMTVRALALYCAVAAVVTTTVAYTVDCNHEYTDCDTELSSDTLDTEATASSSESNRSTSSIAPSSVTDDVVTLASTESLATTNFETETDTSSITDLNVSGINFDSFTEHDDLKTSSELISSIPTAVTETDESLTELNTLETNIDTSSGKLSGDDDELSNHVPSLTPPPFTFTSTPTTKTTTSETPATSTTTQTSASRSTSDAKTEAESTIEIAELSDSMSKAKPRLLDLSVDELQSFANALHNQSRHSQKQKGMPDLSEISLDVDEDDEPPRLITSVPKNKDISEKFYSNLQVPFNPLLSIDRSDEIEICKENEIMYKVGEHIERGCDETCECTPTGIFDCSPRCKHPYIRRGRRLDDPLCFESPVDECCSIIACSTGSGEHRHKQSEMCRYGNGTYPVGSKWHVSCEQTCLCEANSIVTCNPRCKNLQPSDKCINVQDPNDECCEVQVCDVSSDVHEEPDNMTMIMSSTTTQRPTPSTSSSSHTTVVGGPEDTSETGRSFGVEQEQFRPTIRPLVLSEPIGSVTVLQNNSVQVNLMHMNNSEDPVHLLLSSDGGRTFKDVELKYSNMILNLEGGRDYILKTRETGTKFNFTITASDAATNEVEDMLSPIKMGCHHDGKFYAIGEEFHIGCSELCECTGPDTQECAALVCPSHVGLELVSKGCVRWATSPPAEPPNCCPRSARCLSDGTCHYKGVAVPNWSEVPIPLTGCELRCFCENGELDCQEVCTPLPTLPPQSLRCPPNHRPAAVNISKDDCCKQWGCLPNDGYRNGSKYKHVLKSHDIAKMRNYVTPLPPISPTLPTPVLPKPHPTTEMTDFFRHSDLIRNSPKQNKPKSPPPVPGLITNNSLYYNGEEQKANTKNINYTVFDPNDINHRSFKLHRTLPSVTSINVDWQSLQKYTMPEPIKNLPAVVTPRRLTFETHTNNDNHLVIPENKINEFIQQYKKNHIVESKAIPNHGSFLKHKQESVSKVPFQVHNLNYFLPAYDKKIQQHIPFGFGETKNIYYTTTPPKIYFDPLFNQTADYYRKHPNPLTFKTGRHDVHGLHGKHVTILSNKEKKPTRQNSEEDRRQSWPNVKTKASHPYETVLFRVLPEQHTDMKQVATNNVLSKGSGKSYSTLDLEHMLSQMEVESEVNRNLGRSADKNVGDTLAGPLPGFTKSPGPLDGFIPTIPPEIRYPQEDGADYEQNNIHRPLNLDPTLPGLPPGLALPPAYADDNKKLSVILLQADSPTSVKMIFGLPPVLVGLRGSVDLRYTDTADEDVADWYSQIFAPADEVLGTQRLDFRLTGLKPGTTYKIRGKLYLHNLPVEPESDVFTVRTLDLPTMPPEEKRRQIDSRLTVLEVNDTTAHISWRHFSEDELEFIDGIQVRYRPVGTPIFSMTELLHHSRSLAELIELRPGIRYEASLVLIPPPRAMTELFDPTKIEFTTLPYVDPYNWSVVVVTRAVGSDAAELTWSGVPVPAERWVRVYRAAHACGASRKEHDAFRLATRDLPPSVTLTGLEPNSKCRVWLELFLTNGKIKTSNVVEIHTKSADSPEPIDNVIEASSVAGGRGPPRGDYYGALVVVGVIAALGALSSLLLLLVVVRRHRPRSVPITPVPSAPRESSLPPYDNPAYKLELQQETMDL